LSLPACPGACSDALNPTQAGGVGGFGTALGVGDLLMIYQAQELDASSPASLIDTTEGSPSFGAVVSPGGAGLYEFVYVSAIAGDQVTIVTNGNLTNSDTCTGLKNAYDAGAMVVRVPQLLNLTITGAGTTVTAPAWNGSTGGVVALDIRPGAPRGLATLDDWVAANGNLNIDVANGINVSGLGFRGGVEDNVFVGGSGGTDVSSYASAATECAIGARRGESIFGFAGTNANDSLLNQGVGTCAGDVGATGIKAIYSYGRGALANGGGGGNEHNAGGGGGANGGDVSDWTGAGNPAAGFDAAWFLEDDIAQTGAPLACTGTPCNTLVASSGGGRGGYSWGPNDQNALVVPPGDALYGGNSRRIRGGLGGRPLVRGDDRFFFGGGGGAGDSNNTEGGSGGAGGGLAYVIAQRVLTATASGTVLVRADGAAGGNSTGTNVDSPGGGGAGGTIILEVARLLQGAHHAGGGQGGSHLGTGLFLGNGGGGGGGVIAASYGVGTPTFSVPGGANGLSPSTGHAAEFRPNGATSGGNGEIVSAPGSGNQVYQCISGCLTGVNCTGFTTPALTAYFSGQRSAGQLLVEFDSAVELGHVGYYIEGERDGRFERLSGLIARKPGAPEQTRSYQLQVADAGHDRLWIVDVAADGKQTRRGPFAVGTTHGRRVQAASYDWTVAEAEARPAPVLPEGSGGTAAYLRVDSAGMHRVTYEALAAAGVDLSGVPAAELSLSSLRGPVARRVSGGAVFGPGSAIEFYGEPLDDLHVNSQRYLLERSSDGNRVREIAFRAPREAEGGEATSVSPARAQARHVPTAYFYDPVSPTDSPWYMYEIVADAGTPQSVSFGIAAPRAEGGGGKLSIELSGFVDLAGATPDHRVNVYLNGVLVGTDEFDGITARQVEIPVSNVVAGNNTVRVELPADTGYDFDMIAVHRAELHYDTSAQLSGGRFDGSVTQSVGQRSDRFFRDGLGDAVPPSMEFVFFEEQVVIAGRSADSRVYLIGAASVEELQAAPAKAFNGGVALSPGSRFWVGATSQMASPVIEAAPAVAQLPQGTAEYLVIAHPNFLAQAQQLAAHRAGQGLSTAIVDVSQLYRRYTSGNAHPDALRSYFQERAQALGLRYVVLMGGANYNSVGLRGPGVSTLSYVPTDYARTNRFVRFAPTDALLADLTGDQSAEFAIGRLPVRTVAEAEEAVRKLVAYESQPSSAAFLLSSGALDAANGNFSFMGSVDAFQAALPNGWNTSRVDVEAIGTGPARTALLDAINQGRSLISFTGHSSPVNWDNVGGGQSLFNVDDVLALPASANQPVVLQFGCWTTYFVSPVTNTMGNALVLTPNRGASAVFGSTVLLDQPNHDRFAAAIGPLLQPGVRLGDAVEEARRIMANRHDALEGVEVNVGVTLLGDPASLVR
jgi:hypothetical protein